MDRDSTAKVRYEFATKLLQAGHQNIYVSEPDMPAFNTPINCMSIQVLMICVKRGNIRRSRFVTPQSW